MVKVIINLRNSLVEIIGLPSRPRRFEAAQARVIKSVKTNRSKTVVRLSSLGTPPRPFGQRSLAGTYCDRAESLRPLLSASLVGVGLLQRDQLAMEVGPQMGVMVTLEDSQLFDLFLQHSSFAVELMK